MILFLIVGVAGLMLSYTVIGSAYAKKDWPNLVISGCISLAFAVWCFFMAFK
jgi:hypothetical protein